MEKNTCICPLNLSINQIVPKRRKIFTTDQLKRSSASIAANIVEGNEKKTKKDYINFLYIAKGSLSESKYFLLLARDLKYLQVKDYVTLLMLTNEIGKMINGLINYLSSGD